MLGCSPRLLSYLAWDELEWRRFGSSPKFCSALEELTMLDMSTLDGASALIVFSEATCPRSSRSA